MKKLSDRKETSKTPSPAPGKPGEAAAGSKGSASQRADAAAKRGEPMTAAKNSDRSPKQENL